MVVTLGLSLNQRSFLFLHLSESEKQTHLCRTIEIKMQTIANEKISFEVSVAINKLHS